MCDLFVLKNWKSCRRTTAPSIHAYNTHNMKFQFYVLQTKERMGIKMRRKAIALKIALTQVIDSNFYKQTMANNPQKKIRFNMIELFSLASIQRYSVSFYWRLIQCKWNGWVTKWISLLCFSEEMNMRYIKVFNNKIHRGKRH